jgi:hypothetical protein
MSSAEAPHTLDMPEEATIMLDLVVKNISKTYTFQLGQQFIAPPPWGHMEVSPGPMLPAGTMGSAEARMVITGQSIINAADMFFLWYAQLPPGGPEGGIYWFAVRLCQPVNVGPAGYDPYWQMCAWLASEASAIPHLTDSSWTPGQNYFRSPPQSAPYDFNAADDRLPSNLAIRATPQVGSSDISVTVQISDV